MGQLVPSVGKHFDGGERRNEIDTLKKLAKELGADFTVYHGVHWTRERQAGCGFGEIDFIVLNREGHLLVIEQKNGAVESRNGELKKSYGGDADSKSILRQLDRSIDALRKKYNEQRRGGAPLHVDYLIYIPDQQVTGAIGPNIDVSRVVDATRKNELPRIVEDLLRGESGGLATAAPQDVRAFLDGELRVVPDVGTQVEAGERLYTRLTEGLNDAITRLDFSPAPFRLKVSAAAGCGKSQLAYDFALRRARQGKRVFFTCFNRPLSDKLSALLNGQVDCRNYHQMLFAHGDRLGVPRTHETEFTEEYWHAVVDHLAAENIREDEKFEVIVVDEGQDLNRGCWETIEMLSVDGYELLWMEDPEQNLHKDAHEPPRLPPMPIYRDQRNFRTSVSVAKFIREEFGLLLDARNPATGLGGEIYRFDGLEGMKSVLAHRLTELRRLGFFADQIVILTGKGQTSSDLLKCDRVGGHKLRRAIPKTYDAEDRQVYTSGDYLAETVRRFKGQQAPVVILVEFEIEDHSELARRLLYCAVTRATLRLEVLVQEKRPVTEIG